MVLKSKFPVPRGGRVKVTQVIAAVVFPSADHGSELALLSIAWWPLRALMFPVINQVASVHIPLKRTQCREHSWLTAPAALSLGMCAEATPPPHHQAVPRQCLSVLAQACRTQDSSKSQPLLEN